MSALDAILAAVQEISPGDHGPDTALLDEVGLDSLDYATVVVRTEDELGVKLREEDIDWPVVRTIGELAAVFEKHGFPLAA
jgi:acyl carrier protein